MNIRDAEEIALDFEANEPRWPSTLVAAAYAWAFRKQRDRRVSPEYRARAASVAKRLWSTAGRRGRTLD